MRKIKRLALFISVIGILSLSVFLLWISNSYVVPILMYHNIDYSEVEKSNTVSPESFEIQMTYLDQHGYRVISLDRLIQSLKSGKRISRKTVVISFDDAFANNYDNALPILEKYDYPATIYVPPKLVGTEGRLNWQQIKEMNDSIFNVGSHGLMEQYLPDLAFEEQQKEIVESKRVLEDFLESEVKHFSYPIGGFTNGIKELVSEAGYYSAVTTNRGYDRTNTDLFELNRISMRDDDLDNISLKIKFSGYYNLFRSMKKPY